MNNPSSPTPPPSPESSPSSSDDSREITHEDFSAMSPSSAPPLVVVASSFSPLSPMSSSSNASSEPTSSTNFSSVPLTSSQRDSLPVSENDFPEESSSRDRFPVAFPVPLDQRPSSSKAKLDPVDSFCPSCSPNPFSAEVSSSSMDVDIPSCASGANAISSMDNEASYIWGPDSSEGAAGTSFSNTTFQDAPPIAMSETLVSRSTWQVNCSKIEAKSESASQQWSSEIYAIGAGASVVSSTGPPDSEKLVDRNDTCSGWSQEDACNHTNEPIASTSAWPRDSVNSSVDAEPIPASWNQEDSSEGAVGVSWQCDSPNSAFMEPSVSPSPSSTTYGASLSLSPWPPPPSSSANSGATAGISSSTHYPTNPNINSTSVPYGELAPQPMSWRTRASSSPIRLTRVAPTTPPPRPPTPPCPAPSSSRTRGAHSQYPPSPRRSVSPQDRLHSPSTVRRSVSPPLRHHSRSTLPTPSRRSASPPLRGRGLTQRLASPRRSVSPQQPLAQPASPSGRHRLSPRPRSARTPSPRPPRPPNSTPEPSPSPSQHSPRPHHTKMRGR